MLDPNGFTGRYEECEDETALKKRYLQLRVKRAAQAAKSLSCEERTRLLEHRRAELLKLIADASSIIGELEARGEARLKNETLAKCLRENALIKLIAASSNLQNECKAIIDTDPLLTAPPPSHRRSASLEALMQDYISREPGDDLLHLFIGRKTVEIFAEINDRLRDMERTLLEGLSVSIPLDAAQKLNKLKNIQQVALELARCVIIARTQPERINEVRGRVEALRKEPLISGMPVEDLPELSLYNQLRADSLGLRALAETAQQQVVDTTEKIVKMNYTFNDQAGRLRQLCEDLQKVLLHRSTNVTRLMRPVEPWDHDGYENLLYIKIKHVLAATTVPNVQDCLKEIEAIDAPLISQLKTTLSQVTASRDEAKRRFKAFEAECHAIEHLQGRGDARQLLSSVVIKQ